ncbi:MAG: universal stress protein [Paludibacteraceae bacterium]|jgi:nucleotide-binding universal stress UspA family protein|nr:universal stress protein [Paludibacteraceae bacterium]MED9995229.1 universal stress protein [Paludibacteraceae bacterium]
MNTQKPCILVPFSFSEYSFRAGKIAFYWAQKMDCSILFLHVTNQKNSLPLESEIDDIKQQYINEIANNNLPDISFEFHLKQGIVEEEIKRYVKKYNPMLVIMGTRDKKQKQLDLIGSVTAEVMEQIKTPVLAIPNEIFLKPLERIKEIAIATSLGKNYLQNYDKGMQFFKDFEGTIHVLHVMELDEINHQEEYDSKQQKMQDLLQKASIAYPKATIKPKFIEATQSRARELNFYAELHHTDLIVVKKSNRMWLLNKLLFASTAQNLVFHAETALLVI